MVAIQASENTEVADLPFDSNFVEQAEYIPEDSFFELNATHPDEESIIRRLSAGGAKLLVGPRGCGKTTLLLKTYYELIKSPNASSFPVYVNFKLSLKIEPLYQNTPNATFWFRLWLVLKIYEGLHKSLLDSEYKTPEGIPTLAEISSLIHQIEGGRIDPSQNTDRFTVEGLSESIAKVLSRGAHIRCILLLDDAAHAFSPRQQEDFFEFFREVKSREISPKAAIYPGITTHSPTFHVGHDAEQIDVWVRPDSQEYLKFMRDLAARRFGGQIPAQLAATSDAVEFLAYSSFGVPRSFLNMLRNVYHEIDKGSGKTLGRRQVLDIAKQSREHAHNIYDSLLYKMPAYKEFIVAGRRVYSKLLSAIKEYNHYRGETNQALEVGIRRPIPNEISKVLSFFQYAGLVMPAGENSRGEKGVFEIYLVHFGDLVTENAIVGRRTKSISSFVSAFSSQTHQVWPRISPTAIVRDDERAQIFRLTLPNCQVCGSERVNEDSKFCHNCGAQLKTTSIYDQLTRQDISALPLSKKMVSRIKSNSDIKTIKDILIDSDRSKLRSIPFVGPIRAARISGYAEEYLA